MFLVFVLLVILWLLIFFYFYRHFKKCYRLWPSQNVPTIPPTFPMGNLSVKIAYTNFSFIVKDFYKKFKGSSSGDYAGVYFLNKPVLLVLTPEFAKTILAKDFQYFVNRGVYFNKEDDPLSANLFFIENSDWRTLRYKMTPTFTSGKIKTMFYTINDVADELIKHVKPIAQQHCDVEITELLARYNTDVIVSCAFGIDCNSIVDPDSEFRAVGKKMLTFTRAKLYKLYAAMLFRRQARALGFRILHNDVSTFILNMCRKTIHERKAKGIQRKDFMQLMIDLYRKDNEMNEEGLSLAEIAAQVFVFFFAGFETSSTAMTYALYELALHQGIQDRVRQEINDVCEKHDNRMTYDGVAEMTYLDQVVHETMRKHPSVGTLHRVAVKDYPLPNGGVVPKGAYVIVPALAFHHDEEYFPHPDVFDPDRFTDENKTNRRPYSYLPFGEGPRNCIGIRFGMLQTKLGLARLLQNFKFEISPKTDIPIKITSVSLLVLPGHGVWLKVSPI